MILRTRVERTTSFFSNTEKWTSGMPSRIFLAWSSPDSWVRGKSTWVRSPVMTARAPSPRRCQNIFHLGLGGVLRLVEDHEAVFEAASSHISQRGRSRSPGSPPSG